MVVEVVLHIKSLLAALKWDVLEKKGRASENAT